MMLLLVIDLLSCTSIPQVKREIVGENRKYPEVQAWLDCSSNQGPDIQYSIVLENVSQEPILIEVDKANFRAEDGKKITLQRNPTFELYSNDTSSVERIEQHAEYAPEIRLVHFWLSPKDLVKVHYFVSNFGLLKLQKNVSAEFGIAQKKNGQKMEWRIRCDIS